MLLGDNLNDFDSIYSDKSVVDRGEIVRTHKMLYGTRYIVFPNPMYGDWAGAVYNYNWTLTPEQKLQTRHSKLTGF